METDYETEEILFSEERLIKNACDIIAYVGETETPTELVEEREADPDHVTKYVDCNAVYNANGEEYGEDLSVCLKLECDEETFTVKAEHVENEAESENTEHLGTFGVNDVFRVAELGNIRGNLELECDDETEFNEEPSVVNIVPILDHELDTDTDEYNECQLTSYTEGRIRSNKRIKIELVDSDEGNPSIQNTSLECTVVEKPPSSVASRSVGHNFRRCSICGSDFMTDLALKLHTKNKHPSAVLSIPSSARPSWKVEKVAQKKADIPGLIKKCPVCGLQFSERLDILKEFSDHLKLHFHKLYTCRFCEQGFMRKVNLKRHLAFHEDRLIHYCHICGVHFKSCYDLEGKVQAHMQTHAIKQKGIHPVPKLLADHVKINLKNPQPYTCNICGTAFRTLQYLLSHLVNHSNGGQHSCIVCAKECVWKADINLWTCKSHRDICNICGVGNLKSDNFDFHRRWHYGNFYNCKRCDQGFTHQENLQRHEVSTHSKQNNSHDCHVCQEVVDSDDMIRHMKSHRTTFSNGLPNYFNAQIKMQGQNSGLFACNLCGHSIAQVQPLISHLLEHVTSKIACRECGKEFVSHYELNEHAKSHISEDSCCVCNKQILFKEDLKVHHESHFGAPQSCPICEQEFVFLENLEKHKKVLHYGKILHPCLACDVSLSSVELKQHIKQVHRGSTDHFPEEFSSRIMTQSAGSKSCQPEGLICSICGTWYSNLNGILTHLELHKNPKFCCTFCGKEFVWQDQLTHHNQTQHTPAKSKRPCVKNRRHVLADHSYCRPPDWSGPNTRTQKGKPRK